MRDGLVDREARLAAATDHAHNVVVVAGAGTGKTSLLVERVLHAVGAGHLDLPDLGAITFTEKAAGELRTRIADGLEDLRAGAKAERDLPVEAEAARALRLLRELGAVPEEVARRALHALVDLDRATVDTIHGFCTTLIRSHPVEAGIDPRFAIDGGERAATLRREAWDAFVAEELGPSAVREGTWSEVLGRIDLGDLRRIAYSLADFGVSLDVLDRPTGEPTPVTLLGPTARELAADLRDVLSRAGGLSRTPERYIDGLARALEAFAEGGLETLRHILALEPELAARLGNRPSIPAKSRLEGIDRREVQRRMATATHFVQSLRAIDDDLADRIVELLRPFARSTRETMLRRGFLTFDGLLAVARNLLRDHPHVRRAARERFRMLLVDELQDTDPRQYEIILLLATPDGCDATDPLAVPLEPGRLFLVGDPKQSIYRFRGADFDSYRAATEHVLDAGGRELTLAANFRSVPAILEPVNRLFDDATWRPAGVGERHQPPYVAIAAARPATHGAPRVEVWSVGVGETGDVDTEKRRDAEGAILAAEIRDAVAAGRIEYRGITVVLRALTGVSHFLRPLRRLGVPFVVDGGREFLRRPEVSHLLAALRTVTQPTDETALLAFLRSPAGGVSDVELADFVAAGGRWDWRREETPAGCGRIAARFELLRRLAEEVRDVPADTMVRRVLDRTGLVPLGALGFEGAQRVVNLRKLASAAADLAHDGTLSFGEVLEAVEEGTLLDLVSDAPLVDDSVDAVRITSIHKMKGLESDWVFLPDLARPATRDDKETMLARSVRLGASGDALALQVGGVLNTVAAHWRVENELHEQAEEVRVLYVAATRARERLVLLVGSQTRRPSVPWLDALRTWGYDPDSPPPDGTTLCDGLVLHRAIDAEPIAARDEEPLLPAGTTEARGRHDRAVARLRGVRPPFVAPSEITESGEPVVDAASGRPARDDLPRVVGIAVHRFLERFRGEPETTATRSLGELCREVARAESSDAAAVEGEVRAIVENLFASGLAARLSRLDVLGREVPVLAALGGGATLRGTIDLLGRSPRGEVVIVDFKTDRETDPRELRRRHGPQLRAYAVAARDALGLEKIPAAEIWALRAGTVVPVPLAPGDPQSGDGTTKR